MVELTGDKEIKPLTGKCRRTEPRGGEGSEEE